MKNIFKIENDICIRCRHCVEVCPVKLLEFLPSNKEVKFKINASDDCIMCGHCTAICPVNAVVIPTNYNSNADPKKSFINIGYKNLSLFLKSRRSVRVYKNELIEKKEIEKLLDVARYAPSGANTQLVNWLIFSGRDKLHKLAELTVCWMQNILSDADNKLHPPEKAFFTQCINAWEKNDDVILRNAPHLVIVHGPNESMLHKDSIIALDYFELAAASLGFGTCWAGGFYNASINYKPLMEYINLPANHICYGAVMLGYPKFKYNTIPSRDKPKVNWK